LIDGEGGPGHVPGRLSAEGLRKQAFFSVRPAGRTHLEVKVLYSPGKGKS